MGLLKKLLRREGDHAKWLEDHPGKESVSKAPVIVSEEDERRTRATMEREMDEQRTEREKL